MKMLSLDFTSECAEFISQLDALQNGPSKLSIFNIREALEDVTNWIETSSICISLLDVAFNTLQIISKTIKKSKKKKTPDSSQIEQVFTTVNERLSACRDILEETLKRLVSFIDKESTTLDVTSSFKIVKELDIEVSTSFVQNNDLKCFHFYRTTKNFKQLSKRNLLTAILDRFQSFLPFCKPNWNTSALCALLFSRNSSSRCKCLCGLCGCIERYFGYTWTPQQIAIFPAEFKIKLIIWFNTVVKLSKEIHHRKLLSKCFLRAPSSGVSLLLSAIEADFGKWATVPLLTNLLQCVCCVLSGASSKPPTTPLVVCLHFHCCQITPYSPLWSISHPFSSFYRLFSIIMHLPVWWSPLLAPLRITRHEVVHAQDDRRRRRP